MGQFLAGWAIGWADGSNIIVIFCGVCKQQFSFSFISFLLKYYIGILRLFYFHFFFTVSSYSDLILILAAVAFGLFLFFLFLLTFIHFFFLFFLFFKIYSHYYHSIFDALLTFIRSFCSIFLPFYSYMYKYFISYNVCCVWVQRPALTRPL